MDITGIGLSVPQVSDNGLVNAVSTEVLSQSLDTQEDLGNEMVRMMEQSVAPNLGSNIDIQV
ncbi:MAG: YjfB family protein [Eubacterium sp.]|nr:YjfB family protein [Eubacterium sp.]